MRNERGNMRGFFGGGYHLIPGILLLTMTAPLFGAEMLTLFTTLEERQRIDAMRSKPESTQSQTTPVIAASVVNKVFHVSGIMMTSDGRYSVWVNDRLYQSGESIEGQYHLQVIADTGKLKILVPGGKHYEVSAGETVTTQHSESEL